MEDNILAIFWIHNLRAIIYEGYTSWMVLYSIHGSISWEGSTSWKTLHYELIYILHHKWLYIIKGSTSWKALHHEKCPQKKLKKQRSKNRFTCMFKKDKSCFIWKLNCWYLAWWQPAFIFFSWFIIHSQEKVFSKFLLKVKLSFFVVWKSCLMLMVKKLHFMNFLIFVTLGLISFLIEWNAAKYCEKFLKGFQSIS